jgi:hypothetical protein
VKAGQPEQITLIGSLASDLRFPGEHAVQRGIATDEKTPSLRCTNKGRCRRIERVADRLFEGEETVLHVMGVQIASEKRRNPWTARVGRFDIKR